MENTTKQKEINKMENTTKQKEINKMKNTTKQIVDYNEFMDSLGKIKDGEEFNLDEKMEKVYEAKSEPDHKFIKRHGPIKLYLVKYKLARYIKKQEKYAKLLRKYEESHKSLSLAIAAGFSNVKEHQQYLKELSKKVEARNGNN